ncbi:MAG: HNH endonuclease family protein [Micrococcaceae bacterium]
MSRHKHKHKHRFLKTFTSLITLAATGIAGYAYIEEQEALPTPGNTLSDTPSSQVTKTYSATQTQNPNTTPSQTSTPQTKSIPDAEKYPDKQITGSTIPIHGTTPRQAFIKLQSLQEKKITYDKTYNREQDFGGWALITANGPWTKEYTGLKQIKQNKSAPCNTRAATLFRDGENVKTNPKNCTIVAGNWLEPYTNTQINSPKDLQIDHIVPLASAWGIGAKEWSQDKRVAFANDPINLVSSDDNANQAKGDSSAEQWQPVQYSRCYYAIAQINVKAKYGLPVDIRSGKYGNTEKEALTSALNTCIGHQGLQQ